MFGVLVGAARSGERIVLRAFSGMSEGRPYAPGFVGPTRPFAATADEERETLHTLGRLSEEIASIDTSALEEEIAGIRARFDPQIEALVADRKAQKAVRAEARASGVPSSTALAFEAESQREGGRLRALRRERADALAPLEREHGSLTERGARLRRERREHSRTLQRAMHDTHGLVNFAGRYAKLEEFFASGVPTGTGECCAPKLLHEAALRGIRPTGVAEFWWGPPPGNGGREHERFYSACREKCEPILGHLLCGLEDPRAPIEVLHEDADMVVVDKPSGLLSVPGRGSNHADCVETRLSLLRPGEFLRAAHRLDEATSGVLVLARSPEALKEIHAAFASGHVRKEYLARVDGRVAADSGEIRLPIGLNHADRPRRVVDWTRGRDALTRFEVVARAGSTTDLRLEPETGRTHQLRVHCASKEGLAAPIVGDPLYGTSTPGVPLHLHAARVAIPRAHGPLIEVSAPAPRGWR